MLLPGEKKEQIESAQRYRLPLPELKVGQFLCVNGRGWDFCIKMENKN